ncbi:MAG: STAS domain-containing protein [Deltaproteobacteria bacterium]|nr:STAS domain-containing protein [Deltaproteobacteria bacterium]
MAILRRIFPFVAWFKGFDGAVLRADLLAGLTVALVLVPQSMAYAQLAGLPPYYGLYAAFLPPIVAALFGSSRQLATGPVAVVSLVCAAALEPLATAGSEQFVAYAVLLALLVGGVQLLLGLLRLGMIVNFLSHPVVNGFTNAAALIIATSQLAKLFGVVEHKAPYHYETVYRVVRAALTETHWPTLGMAVLALLIMLALKRFLPRLPNVLVAAVLCTALAWAVGYERAETVPLARIEAPSVRQAIAGFNEALALRDSLERTKAASQEARSELATRGNSVCERCHAPRDVVRLVAAKGGTHPPPGPRSVLALHEMSGLLADCLAEARAAIDSRRVELQGFRLRRDGHGQLHLDGAIPAGVAVERGAWRLQVGSRPLVAAALPLQGGGAVVGTVPKGVPALRPPQVDGRAVLHLLPAALIISLLGFMEAISIAKAMAARTRQKLDANQELVGQGLANLVGSLALSYPVSGSFSRSAVALQAGARTGLGNVVSGLVVLVVLLFLARLLYHLPQAVLAAIIMVAVLGLVRVGGFVHAWRANRLDGVVGVVTFLGTLVFAPHLEWGIAMGVALSLGAYLYRTMRPTVVELAPHPDGALRDARRHELRTCRHLAVVSFEGPLNFASVAYLEDEILGRVADKPQLRHVLISGNGISEIDASGEETLRHVVDNLRGAGYEVSFSGLPDPVVDVLRRSHLYDRIGAARFHATRALAVSELYATAHAGSDEPDCPFRQAMPPVVEVSLHPDGSLRAADRHGLACCRHIAAFRFDAPLSFANTAFLEQEILSRVSDRPTLRHVLLVIHGVSGVDEAAAHKLGELVRKLRADGFAVSFSGMKDEVQTVLERTKVANLVGDESMYPTQAAAVAGIYARAHTGSSEEECPLEPLAPRLTELSLHPDGTLRDARRQQLRVCRAIGVLRFDGPLPLGSRRAIQSEFIRWAKRRPSVRSIVLVASTLHRLERGEADNLGSLIQAVREADYRVALASVTDEALETLGRSGLADTIGLNDIVPSEYLAVADLHAAAHEGLDEPDCPFRNLIPRVVELALHADGSLRDARRHRLALCPRIVAVRFDGPLNFATSRAFGEQLSACLARRPAARHVLLAGHTIDRLDTEAAEELVKLFARLCEREVRVAVSGLRDEVLDMVRRSAGSTEQARAQFFPTQARALEVIYAEAHGEDAPEPCPLRAVVPAP